MGKKFDMVYKQDKPLRKFIGYVIISFLLVFDIFFLYFFISGGEFDMFYYLIVLVLSPYVIWRIYKDNIQQ